MNIIVTVQLYSQIGRNGPEAFYYNVIKDHCLAGGTTDGIYRLCYQNFSRNSPLSLWNECGNWPSYTDIKIQYDDPLFDLTSRLPSHLDEAKYRAQLPQSMVAWTGGHSPANFKATNDLIYLEPLGTSVQTIPMVWIESTILMHEDRNRTAAFTVLPHTAPPPGTYVYNSEGYPTDGQDFKQAYIFFNNSSLFYDVEVKDSNNNFLGLQNWTDNDTSVQPYEQHVQNVIMHELGHVLGLHHIKTSGGGWEKGWSGSIMYGSQMGKKGQPTDNDKLAVKFVKEKRIPLDQGDTGGGIDEENLPTSFTLFSNYPNPFNPETNIEFGLADDTEMTIAVYNHLGQSVKTLFSGMMAGGTNRVVWGGLNANAQEASSGVYFIRFTANDFDKTQKVVLLR